MGFLFQVWILDHSSHWEATDTSAPKLKRCFYSSCYEVHWPHLHQNAAERCSESAASQNSSHHELWQLFLHDFSSTDQNIPPIPVHQWLITSVGPDVLFAPIAYLTKILSISSNLYTSFTLGRKDKNIISKKFKLWFFSAQLQGAAKWLILFSMR